MAAGIADHVWTCEEIAALAGLNLPPSSPYMPYIIAAATLAAGVVAVLVLAYLNRGDPEWQRAAPSIRIILYGQLALIALVLIARILFSN
jgi:hypothetical protein